MKKIKKTLTALTCLLTVTASSALAGCDFEALLDGILPSSSSTQTEQSSKDENGSSSTSENEKPDDGGNTKPDDGTGDNTGGDNTGGDNTGGDNTGGDNTGGDNTGGDNTGGGEAPVVPDGAYTLEYTDNGDGYTVTGKGTFAGGALEIPATYNGKPVTRIGESVFYGCVNLYSLTLPSSITSIAMGAFSGCVNLTSVKLGEGLIEQCSLDSGAFDGCYKIAEIYEPTGMLFTGDETMFGGIAANALNVYSMYMGSSGLSTDENGFVIYEAQPDPMMPEMPVSDEKVLVNYIGSATELTIPSVTTVGAYAFYGNNTVQTVSMPDTVKILNESAFSGNVLKKVFIPASVTALASAFSGNISEVEIDANNRYYSSIDGNVYSKDGKELWRYMPGKTATEWTIPSTVETIKVAAFKGAKLVSVIFNKNVKKIGGLAFSGCTTLETVTIHGEQTTLESSAFANLKSLKTATITGTVEIGISAFSGCSVLVNLTLGDGVTFAASQWGVSSAFSSCASLKKVRIPGSVERVYEGMFYGCSLDLLVLEEGVKYVSKEAFSYNGKIKTVVLPASIVDVGLSYNHKIETIYYKGTPEQRDAITSGVVAEVSKLADAWYYYSETTPTDTENGYWYYDGEGNIALY